MAAQVIMAAQDMTRKAKPDQDEDARRGSEWNSRTRAHTHFLSQMPMSSFYYVSSMCSDVHESQEPLQKDWFLTSQLLYSQTSRWSHIYKRVNRNSKVFRDNMLSLRCVGSLPCFFSSPAYRKVSWCAEASWLNCETKQNSARKCPNAVNQKGTLEMLTKVLLPNW